ncbi:MAG: hypothetical protein ACLP56_24840 [Candidatus Sulfotelmatobacter sp.]
MDSTAPVIPYSNHARAERIRDMGVLVGAGDSNDQVRDAFHGANAVFIFVASIFLFPARRV